MISSHKNLIVVLSFEFALDIVKFAELLERTKNTRLKTNHAKRNINRCQCTRGPKSESKPIRT